MIALATGETLRGVAGSAAAITYTLTGDEKGAADAFKVLAQGQLPAAAGTLYTVPAATATLIQNVFLTNVTASPVTASFYINGTAATNQIVQILLPANGNAVMGSEGWKIYDSTGQTVSTSVPSANSVDNVMLADMPANTIKANPTASTADPSNMAFAANTFPARLSSGNITAYAISDAGQSWVSLANLTAMTAALDVATTTTKGLISFADKKMIDSLHYDAVADFGFVGNDSTLNDAAWTTAKATMPVGAVLFFPAGTYRVANEMTIDVDKRFQFRGAGRYASIIKTTSATAHIFNKSVAGWYDTWSDLGFQSSVTKSAGAAINIPAGNNVGMNTYRLWITGLFHGINATGAQSANLSVWSDLDISGIPNGGRGLVINGSTINVQIHNTTINAGSATTSACVEINQSGAVQVTSFDWIQGTNVLLINSTAGAGPQACYFTNGFCDQPQGSVIKIVGTNTANRIKFNAVGIAPTGNNHAVEINGTGAGAVGTATCLPAGLSFIDCDIYSSNGTNTGAGILCNGVQDINIQNCRIAGFNGVGGAGVSVIPSASNLTKVRINGCIIGPNSNLTIANETGVKLVAGASGLAALSITDNTISGNGTAITDASTMMAGASKNINNNTGAAAGLQASLTSATGLSLTTTEQVVLQIPLPANSLKLGTTFRFSMTGTVSGTTAVTVSVRIGTLGTIADAGLVSVTSGAMTAAGLVITGQTTVTAVGASGTHNGAAAFSNNAAASTPTPTVSGTFATTSALFVSVCAKDATAAQHIIRTGSIDIISPA